MENNTKNKTLPIQLNNKENNNNLNNTSTSEQVSIQENLKNLTLNTKAKDYVPRKAKENESEKLAEKLNLNLNAQEYKPSLQQSDYNNPYQIKQVEDEDSEEENQEELEKEELDMIVNDLVENDALEEFEEEEESDDEKWFPKYRECECCKGFIYKCTGSACVNMGACFCKMKDECDDEY